MEKRERIRTIIARGTPDRCGFWLGHPRQDTWDIYSRRLGMEPDAIRALLGDDILWDCPQWSCWRNSAHPNPFDITGGRWQKTAHGTEGPLAGIEDPAQLDAFDWPDPAAFDFTDYIARMRRTGDIYRASGLWCCFYHNVMDYFGMENYMCFMYERPDVVQAVTDRVCTFYYEGTKRLFEEAGDAVDAFFLGNDFGTQIDLICGPEQFDTFIMPWFRRFTELGHAHGKQVILHSCGAVAKVIDRLIDAGVDCLHPLQALATGMDAPSLATRFKGRIAFFGGIDTQQLLVHGTPREIRDDVERVRRELGPHLIISPSHEAILPNVPLENVIAMAEAATGQEIPLPAGGLRD